MDRFAGLAGAYVHIPFCSAVCPYCDFAVVAGQDDLTARYCDAVVAEIGRDDPWQPLDSIYFGGGTPSRMPVAMLGRIVAALEARHGISPGAEVSLEANPEDFDRPTAEGLIAGGFNRISFGAQSFDPAVLDRLGRRHAPSQIMEAVRIARDVGFENISLDLIYGTVGETPDSWDETVSAAVDCGPDHVSCYALTVEPGTILGRDVRAGAPAPDPDVQADRFEVADEVLSKAGLDRYEVSNWARPGMECVYNSIVWAQGEYVAYGNSAHRYRNAMRSRNIIGLNRYLDAVECEASPVAGSEEPLYDAAAEIDRMFVGLRRSAGIVSGCGGDALLSSDDGIRLLDAGVIDIAAGRLRVAKPMLTDVVLRSVLDLELPEPEGNATYADNVVATGE